MNIILKLKNLLKMPHSSWERHNTQLNKYVLDSQELLHIKEQAIQKKELFKSFQQTSEQHLIGLNSSRYRGAGIDYEEQRKFQQGDDFKRVNWRALARTGELYTKLFVEERRPCLYLFLDRRPGMWFGTRKQLKIKQATIVAYYYLFRALAQQKMVGGLLFGTEMSWFNPKQTETSLLAMIQSLNKVQKSNSIQKNQTKSSDFGKLLTHAAYQLSKGSILIIISDFFDYQEKYKASLYQLQKYHRVMFIQVLDPAELELPTSGVYEFRSAGSSSTTTVNCDNALVRQQYGQMMQTKVDLLKDHCDLVGITYQRLLTTDDFVPQDELI